MGTKLSSGQLEITDTDLILYQKGKQPIKWPLKYLKRYGFEVKVEHKLFIIISNQNFIRPASSVSRLVGRLPRVRVCTPSSVGARRSCSTCSRCACGSRARTGPRSASPPCPAASPGTRGQSARARGSRLSRALLWAPSHLGKIR